MEEKQPIKVKLSTVLLIIAVIVLIAMVVIIGIIFKQKTEKNATNNTTLEPTAQKNEEIQQLAVNEQKDVDKIILDELKEKRFLTKNNIDMDSKIKYAKINKCTLSHISGKDCRKSCAWNKGFL